VKQYKPRENNNTRPEIARLAAKILAEFGVNDYLQAKQRAVKQLHLPENCTLPKNSEVHEYLAHHLELFDRPGLRNRQTEFCRKAIKLMELMEEFQPVAVGAVVDGVITKSSALELHVFAATVEDITIKLLDNKIPHSLGEKQLNFVPGRNEARSVFSFLMGETQVNIIVFSEKDNRFCPLSKIDGKPLTRLDAISLRNHLDSLDHGQLPKDFFVHQPMDQL